MTTLPRPPRPYDPRAAGDLARWQRDLQDYLARSVAAIVEASADLTSKQNADPTLSAIAALDATVGLIEQTGSDTFTKRAIGVAAATSIPTRADADARFDAAGTAAAAVTAHVALADPHTQYAQGPASSTDNAIARYDGTSGTIQDSAITVDDNGVLSGHRIGAWTSNADAAVNGYVTVTDNSGNARKLATIA